MSQIPIFLRWAQYTCSLKYAMNLIIATEFSLSLPSCQDPAAKENCQYLITSNNIDLNLIWFYILMLGVIFFTLRILGALILVEKAKTFY